MIDPDLAPIVEERAAIYRHLDGKRVLITGGTGFVGIWMLRALLTACELLGNRTKALVLTRDPGRFAARYPHVASAPQIDLLAGDVRDPISAAGPIDLIVHAAAETNVSLSNPPPLVYLEVSLDGTRRVVELAKRCGTPRIFYTSSGAVYGSAAFANGGAEESASAAPTTTDPAMAYGNAKRACEAFLSAVAAGGGPGCSIARLFAFVGPDLPLDSGFAAGNFIADAMHGGPIHVTGDGTPVRSYLYAADMADWLWAIALDPRASGAYNVGSERPVSIGQLARAIGVASNAPVEIAGDPAGGSRSSRYLPITGRIRSELGVRETVSLEDALARTLARARTATPIATGGMV